MEKIVVPRQYDFNDDGKILRRDGKIVMVWRQEPSQEEVDQLVESIEKIKFLSKTDS